MPEQKSWHPCNPTGQQAEGRELELCCCSDHTAQGTGTRHTQSPAEGQEDKTNTARLCPVKPSVFALWKRHNLSSSLCHSIPSSGHSLSQAVVQLAQLHRQRAPPCTAEQNSLMPIKQLVLSTWMCEEEKGCCCSFKEMFCGNYTARDAPALPSDNIRKVCRPKSQKTKPF